MSTTCIQPAGAFRMIARMLDVALRETGSPLTAVTSTDEGGHGYIVLTSTTSEGTKVWPFDLLHLVDKLAAGGDALARAAEKYTAHTAPRTYPALELPTIKQGRPRATVPA